MDRKEKRTRRPCMRRLLYISAICLTVGLAAYTFNALASDVVLDEDTIPLFPDLKDRYLSQPPFGQFLPRGAALLKKVSRRVELIRVIPLTGNNPMNTVDPINNATVNGQVVFTAVDQLDEIAEGSTSETTTQETASFQSCISSILFDESLSAPPGIYFAGIDIDPNTEECALRNTGDGQTLILQTPPDGGPAGTIAAFPDRSVGNWEFTPPSPAGGPGVSVDFLPGTQQTFYLLAITGLKVKIVLTVTQLGANSYQMTVTDISKVP